MQLNTMPNHISYSFAFSLLVQIKYQNFTGVQVGSKAMNSQRFMLLGHKDQ